MVERSSLRSDVEDLLASYCAALDDDRLEDWLESFGDDASYRILSRENVRQQLPGAILLLESRASIVDRVTALRESAVFNLHQSRHLVSGVRTTRASSGSESFAANLAVYQSDPEGHSRLFCVGTYAGMLEPRRPGARVRLAAMTVTLDTFAVPSLLAVPV